MKKHYTIVGAVIVTAALAALLNLTSQLRIIAKHAASFQSETPPNSSPGMPTGSTLSSIQEGIARREYSITYDSAHHALQSPNRRQNLRAYYRPGNLTIRNRVDSAGQNFQMQLVNEGIYADGTLIAAARPDAALDNGSDTLRITHKGFTEEFINNEEGIRQNFLISQAPTHTRQLSVRLSVRGLHVRQHGDDRLVFYSNDNGGKTDRLTYSDLHCWDANGEPLTAAISISKGQIELNVNVDNAAYPVTIDPIIANGTPANADKTLEINQTSAWLGFSVSTAGDVNGDGYSDVLVGAPKYDNGQADEGAAFLYPGTAGGISLAATALEFNQAGAQMGYSVSNAGDINKDGYGDVLVGAPYYDYTLNNQGAVFVYYGGSQGLSIGSVQPLYTFQADANLGISTALAGDVNNDGFSDILIGAHQYDHGENNEGAAWLYYGSANGLGTFTLLECNKPDAMMGFAVAGAGDVDGDGFSDVMAGARFYSNGQALEGAAFVFKGSANGVITANPTIIEGNQVDARLGHALSSAGDVNGDGFSDIALGAYMYDKGSNNEGAVMIHYGSANGINTIPSLTLESDQIEAQFGISVACAGDVNGDGYADLIAGARYYDKGQLNEGAAFIYQGSSAGLNPVPLSVLESNQGDAWLGSAVAPAGDVNGDGFSDVLVGSYAFDHGQTDEGSVFVWYGEPGGIKQYAAYVLEIDLPKVQFGYSVAGAGDVNGDGFDDVIVVANKFDNGQANEGAAFIYHGSLNGISMAATTIIESNQSGAQLSSASTAGDVDGDGYDDIVVGIPLYDVTQPAADEGAVMIFHGSPQGVAKVPKLIINGSQPKAKFGSDVSTAGDVDSDGYDDIIIGEPEYDWDPLSNENEGRAHVFHGTSNGIKNMPLTIDGPQIGFYFGSSVSGGDDFNADGYDDVIVGDPYYSDIEEWEGAVLVFYGSPSGINPTSPVTLQSNISISWLGMVVSNAGDINGDGFGDIVAGLYYDGNGQKHAAHIYYGSTSGIIDNPTILEGSGVGNGFYTQVSSAGDVNGDGYSDLLTGSPRYSNGQNREGAFNLYLGSPSGISNVYDIKIEVNQDSAYLGNGVASAGDINGDGYGDIVVGALGYDNGQSNEGVAFVLYDASGSMSVRNNLRLYNSADLTTPINHTQFAQNNFGAGLFAKSFTGRNKGKLIWETRSMAQGFSKGSNNRITNSTQSTGSQNAYADLGATGFELKNVIDKQGPGTKVRVRVKYDPVLALTGQSYGPWRYLPTYLMGNSTAPVPEEKVSDLKDGNALELATIYPNPVSDRLNIDFKDKEQVQNVKILTAAGSVAYQSNGFQPFVDVSKFPEGAYFLIITKTDGSHTSRQILIRR
ncbi:MAG: FG-GAP repeat protein [Dyadobacter sp.]|uniref:FG-GAP-like repeat-containing protein n=1 Tax=Dyadobacter sp. TaxID=1914288 RepID=UPI001B102AF9|nr:FG-GAP-like repeat-containing protein [Dyadobacter sp.]MBO9616705.1 FG-GAP repeat protein [Dyadobacter sp.]